MGEFSYYFDEDRWVWSDDLARIHGYADAAAIAPSTALILKHKHPADQKRVEELIDRIRSSREAFSGQHRIVDAAGLVVPVVVVADTFTDKSGRQVGTTGYYVALPITGESDPNTPVDLEAQQITQTKVDTIIDRRSVIEQAKGVVRFVYRLDEQQAFALLVWRSQVTNTKLRELSAAICDGLFTVAVPSCVRSGFDHLLLTAHEQAALVLNERNRPHQD